MKAFYLMRNPIQHYAWGGVDFIAKWQGRTVPSAMPEAECWMGAHPNFPSEIETEGSWMPLNQWINAHPIECLGARVDNMFDSRLPFLLKVLVANTALSIQAHPNLQQAREGFLRENKANIPILANNRNYKDDNHKPELICALTPFTAMCGFRSLEEILSTIKKWELPLQDVPGFTAFLSTPDWNAFQSFFISILAVPKDQQSVILKRALDSLPAEETASEAELLQIRWIHTLAAQYPGDLGALSPIWLQVIELSPGQALYLPAGILHAYLKGAGIEIMANSDNVLRGGLTPKYIDVAELSRVVLFEPYPISFSSMQIVSRYEKRYSSAANEFCLSVIELTVGDDIHYSERRSGEIVACYTGEFTLQSGNTSLVLKKGEAVFIPFITGSYNLTGVGTIYKADVPY